MLRQAQHECFPQAQHEYFRRDQFECILNQKANILRAEPVACPEHSRREAQFTLPPILRAELVEAQIATVPHDINILDGSTVSKMEIVQQDQSSKNPVCSILKHTDENRNTQKAEGYLLNLQAKLIACPEHGRRARYDAACQKSTFKYFTIEGQANG